MSEEVTLNHVLQAVVELTSQLSRFEKETNKRFDRLESRMEKLEYRMNNIGQRFDTLESNLSEKIDSIDMKLDILNNRILTTKADVLN